MNHTAPVVGQGERALAVRKKLVSRTPKSAEIARKGAESLAQEIVQTVDLPHRLYIDSAEGPYLTDVDGNQYIDLTGGFGPNVLGNKPATIEKALLDQIRKGWHFGIPNANQATLANLICESSEACDQVMFCNSGSEATMYAIRAARAFTGKQLVAQFEGSYHGIHDYALIKADTETDRSNPGARALGAGVPPAIGQELVMMLPYRDDNAFELIRARANELAVVLIEPAQSSNPRLDNQGFLNQLSEVCTECGVLLLFDEVITGFRISYGGGQEYYNIKPDIVTYGKAIGGGMAVGAVGGRQDIMNVFSGADGAPAIFAGGTFSGNPATMAAGVAAIETMKANKEEIYPYLIEQGDRIAAEVNEFCKNENIPAQLMNAGSMLHLLFTAGEVNSSRDIDQSHTKLEREFYLHLLGHNVLVPGIHLAFISWAHTPEIVDKVIEGIKLSFMDLRADGLV